MDWGGEGWTGRRGMDCGGEGWTVEERDGLGLGSYFIVHYVL